LRLVQESDIEKGGAGKMYEEITLQDLDRDKVNVMRQKYIELEGTSYPIGDIFRRSYANSANGRKQVQEEIAEPYLSAVMAVWGEEPTVFPEEPEIIETEA
jgi:hypothetical protein